MMLTKTEEAEVLKAYLAMWETYFNGDIETFESLLDDDFKMIGTSETEICNNKGEALEYFRALRAELEGKTEFRNRKIDIHSYEAVILVNETADIFALVDGQMQLYSAIRLSTFVRKSGSGWKMFHQHGSLPDMRVQEGETMAFEKLSKENIELRDAVKRRTLELERKNQELKIESSLERVRAQAMGMKTPEDLLNICEALFGELRVLGFDTLRNAVIQTYVDEKNYFVDYDYSDFTGGFISQIPYTGNSVIERFISEIRKSKDAFTEIVVTGKELEDWKEFRIANNEAEDSRLNSASALCYYIYSIGVASIGISTFDSISIEKQDTLKRFRNVFDFAWRRYMDVAQAELQAREAQIELSLERVRARTMAMHSSAELADTAAVLFQQMKELGFETWSTGFCIWAPDDCVEAWMSASEGGLLPPMRIPYHEEETHQKIFEAFQRGEKSHEYIWEGKALDEHYNRLRSIPSVNDAINMLEASGINLPSRQCYYVSFFNNGYLLNITKETRSDAVDLTRRFAKVFEQTYTRFLDLQKAEAQAREATIETSLERIRSSSMAMHSSLELKEVITVIMEQFRLLGFQLDMANFNVVNMPKDWNLWLATPEITYPEIIHFPYIKHPLFDNPYKAYKNGLDFMSDTLTFEEKNSIVGHLYASTKLKDFDSEERKKYVLEGAGFARSVVFMNNIILTISNFKGVPYSVEQNLILKRFAKVFEQAYIRFLDLQKAEAQARESQIELALERVRAKTMAMQKSSELKDIIRLVYDQFIHLNIHIEHAGFLIDYKASDNMNIWLADSHEIPTQVTIPYFDSPHWNSFNEAKQTGQDFFANLLSFDEKNKFYQDLFKAFTGIPEEAKDYYFNSPGLAISTVLLENIGLYIENFLGIPYTTEENNVLMRFGKVFQQTYTRFLDLQKAEEQGKESQIQLALERVRARTMAMQHSDELIEAANILFQQTEALGGASWNCGFNIWDEDKKFATAWNGSKQGIGEPFRTPSDEDVYARIYAADQRGESLYVEEMGGPELVSHYEYLSSLPGVGRILAEFKAAGIALPTFQIIHVAFFTHGYLMFITYEPVPQLWDVFKRLAKVFEQTYIRFLDLQKAEVQTRESQIELSLERVRAKTMAMHNSNDVGDTAAVMVDELKKLGIKTIRCGLGIMHERGDMELWTIRTDETNRTEIIIGWMDMNIHPLLRGAFESWQRKNDSYSYELKGSDLMDYFTAINNYPGYPIKYDISSLPDHMHHNEFYFPEGILFAFSLEQLNEEHRKIFKRFAGVFGQTYRRYLDLKKAEAQAREAQIEAALEKVRSRSLAMHHSDEIGQVVWTTVEKLKELDIELNAVSIVTFLPDSRDTLHWYVNPDQEGNSSTMLLPYFDDLILRDCMEAKESGKELLVKLYSKEEKNNYFNRAIEVSDFKNFPDELKQWVREQEYLSFSFAIQKHSGIFLEDYSGKTFSDEENAVLIRFSRVFEQSYTRFLDLQKSETQARESQIELALERVRARTMAMQHSNELADASFILAQQVESLGIKTWGCAFNIIDKDQESSTEWFSGKDGTMPTYKTPRVGIFKKYYEKGQQGETLHVEEISGSTCTDHYEFLCSLPVIGEALLKLKHSGIPFPSSQIDHVAYFKYGHLLFITFEPVPEAHSVFVRFAKVFEQTYTRFLDLQKAEAQAKAARIEVAVERVRAKALAMHNSAQIMEVVATLKNEMLDLEIPGIVAATIYLQEEGGFIRMWDLTSGIESEGEFHLTLDVKFNVNETHPGLFIRKVWNANEKYFIVKQDPADMSVSLDWLRQYNATDVDKFEEYFRETPFKYIFHPTVQLAYGKMSVDLLDVEPPAEMESLMLKMGSAFDLAYKRFLDLKQAEAQAREAQIEAALERVRSRTLAMQKSDELAETAAVLFRQLISLGIAPNRLYIGVITDEEGHIEFWVTDEDGARVSTQFIGDIHRNISMKKMYDAWQNKRKSLTIDMQGEELQSYFDYLAGELHVPFKQGLTQKRRVQSIAIFAKGFIGIASPDEQPAETISLLERFAAVFNLTFTRFNDLKIAEAHAVQAEQDLILLKEEKQKTEIALTELKATQSQLIQAEKMASLGQLTAGIAHEIQNPLNFVNNFSEVSDELIAEAEGNRQEAGENNPVVTELLMDIKQNLQKINHHGKRADAIVKGMLQHSRGSRGQKELTDLNALVDEYVKLAFHGFRGKDNAFEAKIISDFDPSVGTLEVAPNEIGRVLLNILNNGFFAVSEKRRFPGGENYEPTIHVWTKSSGGKVEITVKDNGNGIPEKIVDKVFQPFFTTRPTGQGTGLGLSLSYDIIKAHGGDISVASIENEGAEFVIILPINS